MLSLFAERNVDVQVLDLDGSLSTLRNGVLPETTRWLSATHWGPLIRLACTFGKFHEFSRWLADSMPEGGPTVALFGSGDFHHVTLALLERLREPFNLLVLDKHPDWMRGIPFLHCGTWLRHALRLNNLRRVFHCGGAADFDNAYRWLAPWGDLRSGRVTVFPARRRFTRGKWSSISTHPLLVDGRFTADGFREAFEPVRFELSAVPLYITIDKDVLVAEEAAVNWDSGFLRTIDAISIIEAFIEAAGGRLLGADLNGDWSPIRLSGGLSRFCDWLDRSNRVVDSTNPAEKNQICNLAFLKALGAGPHSAA